MRRPHFQDDHDDGAEPLLMPVTALRRRHGLPVRWLAALLSAMFLALHLAAGMAAIPSTGSFNLYTHRHWILEDGAPPDIWAIAQAPDGFLWLGTGAGLYRFDGVRFERFHPLPGESLGGANIVSLLTTRSGDLWIGYMSGGVSLLRNGHLTNFDIGTHAGTISGFVATSDGQIWAAVQDDRAGGLSHFDGRRWHPLTSSDGIPDGSVPDIALDHDGNLWAATLRQVFIKPAGTSRFVATGEMLGGMPSHLVADPQHGMWTVGDRGGTRFMPLPGSLPGPPHQPRMTPRMIFARNLFFDRAGAMWGDLRSGGLFRISDPQPYRTGKPIPSTAILSTFTATNGLSANQVRPFLQDREGTIWIGTNGGLDRFRPASITKEPAIAKTFGDPSLGDADESGTVYIGQEHALYALAGAGAVRRLTNRLPMISKVCVDGKGAIWTISEDYALQVVQDGRVSAFEPVPRVRAHVLACARAPDGRMWVSVAGHGLLRQKADFGLAFERPSFPQGDAEMLFFAPSGDLWIVDEAGRLLFMRGGSTRLYSAKDGLRVGSIQIVLAGSQDILVGGDLGLARFDGHRFQTLRAEEYPALSRVTGIAQQGDATWLFGITALARIRTGALRAAFAKPGSFLNAQIFDSRDGLPGSALQDWESNTLIEGKAGRLWLLTNNGVGSIDPHALVQNPVAPPVTIRGLTAGGHLYISPHRIILPKGVTDVQIDYAASSLAVPERVRVLYRLDGADSDWTDPGPRRQAFYTNLEPGTYRFQVIAANDSGVWNEQGGSFTFIVSPTFTQTLAFKLLCGIAILLVASGLYIVWLRQIGRNIQMRLEERLGERERIARELHDTLLQGIQGLMLRFQAVANRLPKDNDERHMLDRALDSAEGMIVEGRTSLMELRTIAPPISLRQGFADFAKRQALQSSATFEIREVLEPRPLMPVAHHEAARIGEEAIFNALRHGRPGKIEIEIDYGARTFGMAIRDDGSGIDPAILRHGGRDGHFGLAGMRERARRMRGRLRISNRSDGGTEVSLKVPARIAYGQPGRWSAAFSRRRRAPSAT